MDASCGVVDLQFSPKIIVLISSNGQFLIGSKKEGRKERKKAEGKSNRKTEKNEQMNQRGMRVPVVAADA